MFYLKVAQGRGVGKDGKIRREAGPHISQVCGDLDALEPGEQHSLVPRTHPVGLPLTRWDPSPGLFDIKPWAPSSLPPFLKILYS